MKVVAKYSLHTFVHTYILQHIPVAKICEITRVRRVVAAGVGVSRYCCRYNAAAYV